MMENSSSKADGDADDIEGKHGLRTIAQLVLQVLFDKKTTTYKEVSDIVTCNELNKEN